MPAPLPIRLPVLDSTMTYREAGAGRPVLLLHGNRTEPPRDALCHLPGVPHRGAVS